MNLLDKLYHQGFLPLIANRSSEEFIRIIDAAHIAGIKVLEFAARSADAQNVFSKGMSHLQQNKYDIQIGVGSMFSVNDVNTYFEKGAQFIVCPHLDLDIANFCHMHNLPWIPGAATATEIILAKNNNAAIIKIFPADSLGGPKFIKALCGPITDIKLMPSGGVIADKENIKSWFDVGIHCVGIGASLLPNSAYNDTTLIANKFFELSNTIKELRNVEELV